MKLKKRVDYTPLIRELLAPWGVWTPKPGQLRAACPVHKGDNRTTFFVSTAGRWRCFKCGAWGDMANLLMVIRGMTFPQARDALGGAVLPFALRMEDIPDIPPWEERSKPKAAYDVLHEAETLAFRNFCPVYLLGRGFSEAALRMFDIGYDRGESKIVLPVRDHAAKLVGLTYRVDFDEDRDQPAKYWHDLFSKSLHLYGLHLFAGKPLSRLYVVEGQLDAVRMWQLGRPAVAIMGSEMSQEQATLLLRHCQAEQVVLAYDNDDAGRKATQASVRRLGCTRFGPRLSLMRYAAKDPGELTELDRVWLSPWYRHVLPHT